MLERFLSWTITEILLDGVVIDVDGPGTEPMSSGKSGTVQKCQKSEELESCGVIDRDAIGAAEPFTALSNGTQIGLDSPLTVVDPLKEVRHFLELFFIDFIVINGNNSLLLKKRNHINQNR